MPSLQPFPKRVPIYDSKGQMAEQWERFFLSTQTIITLILSGQFQNPSVSGLAGASAWALEGLGVDTNEFWSFGLTTGGPPGPAGPTGPQGLPGVDGDVGGMDEPWTPTVIAGITRSGQVGLSGPVIVATGRTVGAVAAVPSVVAYTVGASDGSFAVSANVLVTTATTHAFTAECAYTDEGGTPRVITFAFENLAGSFLTSISNAQGTVPYEGVPLHIRCLAASTITIRTQAAGVYTVVVFNIEAIIQQLT